MREYSETPCKHNGVLHLLLFRGVRSHVCGAYAFFKRLLMTKEWCGPPSNQRKYPYVGSKEFNGPRRIKQRRKSMSHPSQRIKPRAVVPSRVCPGTGTCAFLTPPPLTRVLVAPRSVAIPTRSKTYDNEHAFWGCDSCADTLRSRHSLPAM